MRTILLILLLYPVLTMALEFPEPDPIYVNHAAVFSWDHPTTKEDRTPISLDEIDHYELFYGLQSDAVPVMVDVGKVTAYRVDDLPAGEYSSGIIAVDINGIQSQMSEIVNFTILAPSRPSAPGNLDVNNEYNYTAIAVDDCMRSGECVADINLRWK